jgi:hypothetical protein
MQLNRTFILPRNELLRKGKKLLNANKIKAFGPANSHADKIPNRPSLES